MPRAILAAALFSHARRTGRPRQDAKPADPAAASS